MLRLRQWKSSKLRLQRHQVPIQRENRPARGQDHVVRGETARFFIPAFLSHFRLLLLIIVIVIIIIIIIIIIITTIRRGWLRLRVCGSWWLVACLASE